MGVVVVTGATGGAGEGVVRALLQDPDTRLAVPYRDEAAADRLRALGGERLLADRADLLDEAAVGAFADQVRTVLGPADGLVCLAGGYAGGAAAELDAAAWRRLLDLNVVTAAVATRAFLPDLRRTRGAIVYTGSRVAVRPFPGAAAAVAAKAAVHALVAAVALEERPHGVRVNAVVPTVIDTPGNRAAQPAADASSWTPPERLGAVIRWLLGPEGAVVSGALVPLEGRP